MVSALLQKWVSIFIFLEKKFVWFFLVFFVKHKSTPATSKDKANIRYNENSKNTQEDYFEHGHFGLSLLGGGRMSSQLLQKTYSIFVSTERKNFLVFCFFHMRSPFCGQEPAAAISATTAQETASTINMITIKYIACFARGRVLTQIEQKWVSILFSWDQDREKKFVLFLGFCFFACSARSTRRPRS